jgi:acetoin utilization deacetylase AcuC-like enzyme
MKVFYHPDQVLHRPKSYFSKGAMRKPQEVPERIDPLLRSVASLGLKIHEPLDAGIEAIIQTHSEGYVDFLQFGHAAWVANGPEWGEEIMSNIFVRDLEPPRSILGAAATYIADGSSPVGANTWKTVYAGAKCALAGARELNSGALSAYALCRPPGHHARKTAAGGFCYLNNAAIAVAELQKKFKKICILDTDVHHGQGVQEIFYDRRDVFYVSVHGDPKNFYPVVSGYPDEAGAAEGEGFNLNLPLAHGSSEQEFMLAVMKALSAIEAYQPDCLILCHGYDIYENDPQTKVAVSTPGFKVLGRLIRSIGLPTLVVQEGGYAIEKLETNSNSFWEGFLA